jgi:DNA topoisomerase-3
MRICPDRECGYRKSLSVQTNARCPNCHKKLELRGEGEKRSFYCICGHRERLADFEKRRTQAGANKNDIKNYLQSQKHQEKNAEESPLALQLAKWKAQNKDRK